MDSSSSHLVELLPLRSLMRDGIILDAQRGRQLGDAEIRELLRTAVIPFVLADVAHPLRWVEADARFELWKSEIQPRLVAPDQHQYFLGDFPGEYCYVASEWLQYTRLLYVSFEKHH